MSTPTKLTACYPVTLVLEDIATGERPTCKFDIIFRNGEAFLETRQGDDAISGPPGSVSGKVEPKEGETITAKVPPGKTVVSVDSTAPEGEATVESQDGTAQSESTGQAVDGEPSDGAGVTEDGEQGEGSQQPTDVCVLNPSTTEISGDTRVLIAQDQEENWVVIWAECS